MMNKICLAACISALLTCANPAHALVIQKTANGYVIMVTTPTGKHCWGMPQKLDLKYFPTTPMDIEAAAKRYKWPKPSGAQAAACKAMMNISWKVYTNQDQAEQPVYQITDNKDKQHNKVTDTVIDKIHSNNPCGEYVNNYGISNDLSWRLVTGKNGKQGAALCKEHK